MPNKKLDTFFADRRNKLTFDDVRMETGYADFSPDDIDLTSRVSRNVEVKIPFISAAMDTVTGDEMAIAVALLGGIGSIHRGFSPEEQAKKVARVKHHIHGRIPDPVCVESTETIAAVLDMLSQKKYTFESLPVVDHGGVLVGLLTHQDFKNCDDTSVLVRDGMTPYKELITGTPEMSKQKAYKLLRDKKKNVLPLINKQKKIVGMYVLSDLKRILIDKSSNHNVDHDGRLRVAAAVGIGKEALLRASLLATVGVDIFHIDMAHGWSKAVIETIHALKKAYPHIDVIAGNVSRGEAALALAKAGADGILVGQGGGSICTTRRVTGIGKPQVSAVYECVKAVEGKQVPIISDGGIRESGDVVIALAAGASVVMAGGIFAGTDEAPGDTQYFEGRRVKSYRGMGSLGAQRESASARQRYFTTNTIIPEGVEGMVAYKGSVREVLEQYVGGVRKGMFDGGAKTIKDLGNKAELFAVTASGVKESHVHDLVSYKDAPNYTRR